GIDDPAAELAEGLGLLHRVAGGRLASDMELGGEVRPARVEADTDGVCFAADGLVQSGGVVSHARIVAAGSSRGKQTGSNCRSAAGPGSIPPELPEHPCRQAGRVVRPEAIRYCRRPVQFWGARSAPCASDDQ